MFNSNLKEAMELMLVAMKGITQSIKDIKTNYSSLKSRLDGQITHFTQENQSLRDKNESLRKRLHALELFLGVEYFDEHNKGYRKVKVTKSKK